MANSACRTSPRFLCSNTVLTKPGMAMYTTPVLWKTESRESSVLVAINQDSGSVRKVLKEINQRVMVGPLISCSLHIYTGIAPGSTHMHIHLHTMRRWFYKWSACHTNIRIELQILSTYVSVRWASWPTCNCNTWDMEKGGPCSRMTT